MGSIAVDRAFSSSQNKKLTPAQSHFDCSGSPTESQNRPTARGRQMKDQNQPVITGIGIVSPVGIGWRDFWTNLIAGKSGVGPIHRFDASSYPCRIAGEVEDFDAKRYIDPRAVRIYPRGTHFACAAYAMAWEDAGHPRFDRYRTDVIIGAAQISFEAVEEGIGKSRDALKTYDATLNAASLLKTTISVTAAAVAGIAGVDGHVLTISSACTSGIDAIGVAADRIRSGTSSAAICGGVDTVVTKLVLNAFCRAGMLCTDNDNTAVAPFDERHTKAVLGEGCAMLILESRASAVARGATIYAEIDSHAQLAENHNLLFSVERTGKRWAECLRRALGKTKRIDHINAHGPSDAETDRAEARAFRETFGAGASTIPVSSIKAAIGGSMGGAGALQVAAAAISIREKSVPPTLNFHKADTECSLSCAPTARKADISSVLVSGHGLGGLNSTMILKEFRL